MAKVIFYEKTGCVNNTKQKEILTMAGHSVEAINLVTYNWTKEELVSFFQDLPVKDWFNKNAPSVSSGETIPEKFTAEAALEAMLADHLLIRRPLMVIGNKKMVGFNKEELDQLIGITNATEPKLSALLAQNLSDCPQKSKGTSCN